MNDEQRQVMVDPHFPIEWRDVSDFLNEFGPFNGRYVPRYPNDWTSRLKARIDAFSSDSLKPVKRQELLERVRREAELCTLQEPWSWASGKSWSANIEDKITGYPKPIVVGDALDPSPFESWTNALDDIRQSKQRTLSFENSISGYVALCRPLFINSPVGYIVDPYFNPFSSMSENLFRSIFTTIKGSKCYSIELITRREKRKKDDPLFVLSDDEISKKLLSLYSTVLPKGRTLKIHIVSEPEKKWAGGLQLHDRFIITMYGSINFGHGFKLQEDQRDKTILINAFVLDRAHHKELKQTYIKGVALHADHLQRIAGIEYPLNVKTFVVAPPSDSEMKFRN